MTKKIKKVFRTPYDESVLEGTLEHFNEASMTEPDNSMSIPEIIAKYTRGQGLQVRQHPWSVGEASEDGYQVGDGVDPEAFLMHGISDSELQDISGFEKAPAPEKKPPQEEAAPAAEENSSD